MKGGNQEREFAEPAPRQPVRLPHHALCQKAHKTPHRPIRYTDMLERGQTLGGSSGDGLIIR
eukprot:101314-Rhodomonas_salina.1